MVVKVPDTARRSFDSALSKLLLATHWNHPERVAETRRVELSEVVSAM